MYTGWCSLHRPSWIPSLGKAICHPDFIADYGVPYQQGLGMFPKIPFLCTSARSDTTDTRDTTDTSDTNDTNRFGSPFWKSIRAGASSAGAIPAPTILAHRLAPTDRPAGCLASRLRLMPIGRLLRARWKRLCGWARQCKLQYGRIVCMCTAASVALSWAGDAPSSWFCCVWLSVASITLCRATGRQSVRLLPAPVGIYRKPGERRFEPWSPPYSLRIACVTVRPWIHYSIRQFATGMKYSRLYRGKYYGRLALPLPPRPTLLSPAPLLEQPLHL